MKSSSAILVAALMLLPCTDAKEPRLARRESTKAESLAQTDTDIGSTEFAMSADGSFSTSRVARSQTASRGASAGGRTAHMAAVAHSARASMHATVESAVMSTARVFGFSDTCNNLWFAGFQYTDACRDDKFPEFDNPSCRCMRSGVAWPAKACDTNNYASPSAEVVADANLAKSWIANAIVEGGVVLVENATSVKRLEDAKREQNAASKAGASAVGNEVYGVCDACCSKETILAYELFVPFLILGCCCCCFCACQVKMIEEKNQLKKMVELERQRGDQLSYGLQQAHSQLMQDQEKEKEMSEQLKTEELKEQILEDKLADELVKSKQHETDASAAASSSAAPAADAAAA